MNYFWAFCVGGAICVAGQLLIDLTGLTPARILTGYVVAGAAAGVTTSLVCGVVCSWVGKSHDQN